MMPQNSSNQGLLISWKEIASYLACDERTCRRWEVNFGLPVHRMEGTSKSRVYAYKNELDAWRREKLNGVLKANGEGQSTTKRHKFKSATMLLWLLLLVVVIAAAIFLFRPSPGQPADFRIIDSKLIVLDNRGKELWAFDTGLPNLEPEGVYRGRFQKRARDSRDWPSLPIIVMKDINHDGKIEVLFSKQVENDEIGGEGDIFCFSPKGDVKWHYKVGRQVAFGGKDYSPDFEIHGFEPTDVDNDGNLEILLIAFHSIHSPCQFLALDSDGRVIGEFFNYGQINDLLCCDLDNNGKKEILIGGLSDEYGKGFLGVFDASQVSGCSPQGRQYPGDASTHGSELFYIIFPRTDVDRALNPIKEGIHEITLLQNDRIQVQTTGGHLFFELDRQLRLQDIKASDYFRNRHRDLKSAGKISSNLDDAYYEALKKDVLYWNGTEWTSVPSMNRKR